MDYWSGTFFLIWAFNVKHFLTRTALAASHRCCWAIFIFSFSLKYFLISLEIHPFTYGLFICVLFNFQYLCILYMFLLIPRLITLWSEHILFMISVPLCLSWCALWPRMCSVLVNAWKEGFFCCYYGCSKNVNLIQLADDSVQFF